jgi:hypothetical protein
MTKRSVLSLTAKIFDSIGFLTPLTVVMKMLFQQLCLSHIDWDDELSGDALQTWTKLLNELNCLNDVRIPRCYFQFIPVQCEIHGFCDASDRAYAAVLYLRCTYDNGEVGVRLVASKSRVAPIMGPVSIPRLELLGAVLLARLMSKFLSNVKPVNWICWTDSMTTLCWIKNERIWKQFVQHRVNKIRELTSKEVWRHCPGELNQADIPSRDQSGKDLSQNTTWWNGPSFLYLPQTDWPKQQGTQCNNDIALQEARKGAPTITYSMANASLEEKPPRLEEVIDPKTIQRFIEATSSYSVGNEIYFQTEVLFTKPRRPSQRGRLIDCSRHERGRNIVG